MKGEELLKKYKHIKGVDFLSILTLEEEEFTKLLENFKIGTIFKEESFCNPIDLTNKLQKRPYYKPLKTQYTLLLQDEKVLRAKNLTTNKTRIISAFAIGFILLNKDLNENEILNISFKTDYYDAYELSTLEKTFIYSLIMPFSSFKKLYTNHLNKIIGLNGENITNSSLKEVQNPTYFINNKFKDLFFNEPLAYDLYNFYWQLYYDELSEIYNQYVEIVNNHYTDELDKLSLNRTKK